MSMSKSFTKMKSAIKILLWIFIVTVSLLGASTVLAENRTINLVVAYKNVNFTGKTVRAIAVNSQIPGPTLHFKKGDHVNINVYNHLDTGTIIHWHGVILPWQMDGVEGISQPAIPPGGVFHYHFTLRQSGTYWYHSHAEFQEQQGLYGAFIIDPPKPPSYHYTKDYVIVLSDWSNTRADKIFANLKKEGDYYSPRFPLQPSLIKFIHDYRKASPEGRKALITDYKMMQQMRMSIYDFSDVAYDAFLLNGQPNAHPWTAPVKEGEVVRLRFIGAGGSTNFRVKIMGATMQMVHVQGNDIRPYTVKDFTITPGETDDVLVKIQKDQPYIIYAESADTLGAAYGALITHPNQPVNYKNVTPFPEPLSVTQEMMNNMAQSGMGHESMNMSASSSPMKMDLSNSSMYEKMKAEISKPIVYPHHQSAPSMKMDESMGMSTSMAMKSANRPPKIEQNTSQSQKNESLTTVKMASVTPSEHQGMSMMNMSGMKMNASSLPPPPVKMESSNMPSMDEEMMQGMKSKPATHSDSQLMPLMKMNSSMKMDESIKMGHTMPMDRPSKPTGIKQKLPSMTETGRHKTMKMGTTMPSKHPSISMMNMQPASMVMNKTSSMKQTMTMDMKNEPSIKGDLISTMNSATSNITTTGTKYQNLVAAVKTNNPNKPITGVIKMELFGYMDHYIWMINGLPEYKASPILFKLGKRYRIIFTNESMMHHPMHIHGHWFILRNGHGVYDPLLHTVDVPPGATVVVDVDADVSGQWIFHCHHLYHMMAGMARVFQYTTIIDVAKGTEKPQRFIAQTPYINRPIVRVDEDTPIIPALIAHPMMHAPGLYLASFLDVGNDFARNIQEVTFKGLYGGDYNKLELYTENAQMEKGIVGNADLDIFYWRLLSQFWAVKGGMNYFYRPAAHPYWQPGVGIEGLMPYFIDTNIRTYLYNGSVKFDIELSRDTQITNNFFIRTGIESIFATKTIPSAEIGGGMNEMQYTLRPYYRLRPGVNVFTQYQYTKDYGALGGFDKRNNQSPTESSLTLGVSLLF